MKAVQQATVNLFADMGVQPANLQPDLQPAEASTDQHRRRWREITTPGGGAIAEGLLIESPERASDREGGLVAAVEVSVDGGATWHPAVGTRCRGPTTWEVRRPMLDQTTILSRAVDDSNNLGRRQSRCAFAVATGPDRTTTVVTVSARLVDSRSQFDAAGGTT